VDFSARREGNPVLTREWKKAGTSGFAKKVLYLKILYVQAPWAFSKISSRPEQGIFGLGEKTAQGYYHPHEDKKAP
jgi:hypothetical protein